MFDLINFSSIIGQHYNNLIDDSNKALVAILFFIIPTSVSFILVIMHYWLNKDVINGLLVAFTIFTAILPNVIVIQVGIRKDLTDQKTFSGDPIKVSDHLYTDSVYSLLISVLILAVMIFILIVNLTGGITSLIVYSLVGHFLITFLMVIQRFFILLFPEPETNEK